MKQEATPTHLAYFLRERGGGGGGDKWDEERRKRWREREGEKEGDRKKKVVGITPGLRDPRQA